ncbi:hypothetical protein HCA42_02035 [Listeria welshimeri]|nr:hypothetical protein [Listeria welshimeri]
MLKLKTLEANLEKIAVCGEVTVIGKPISGGYHEFVTIVVVWFILIMT